MSEQTTETTPCHCEEAEGRSGNPEPSTATEDRPLVTFALFAYNQEKYIREAVEGALSQEYQPLEIIISDDNSSDNTFNLIKEIVSNYHGPHKVKLNRNSENLGVARHVNKLVGLANGELIVAAAGDDVSFSQRVSELVAAWLASGRPPAMCSQAVVISATGEKIADRFHAYDDIYPHSGESRSESIKRLLSNEHCILLGCTEAWTPEVSQKFGPLDDQVVHEDIVIALRAWLLGQIVYLDQPLIKYRTHATNISFRMMVVPRSISDFMIIEFDAAKRQRNKIINLHQHLADLRLARAKGYVEKLDLTGCEEIIEARINEHTIRGALWSSGTSARVISLMRCIGKRDFKMFYWLLPRLFGLRVFSAWRACLTFGSRCRRRFLALAA